MIRKLTTINTDIIANKSMFDLITSCSKNQKHPQDLLLCQQHGSILEISNNKSFLIGPGLDGISSYTHLDFIKTAVNSIITEDEIAYVKLTAKKTKTLEDSIHLEKLIYLKIWENVFFIKILTQFVRLACGESYDWGLKIPYQRGNTKSDHIRKNIIEKIKSVSELFYSLLIDTYSQQIRNAISHSQYYFIQGGIYYSNFKSDKYSTLEAMGYIDWEDRFSKTISLFLAVEKYLAEIHKTYLIKTMSQGNRIEIMVPLQNNQNGNMLLEYEERGRRWIFKK